MNNVLGFSNINSSEVFYDVQEEGRRDPWSWKGSMQQYRGIPGQGSRRRLIGKQAERRGLMELSGREDPGKGKLFEI